MRKILILLSLFSLPAHSAPLMTCEEAQLYQQDESGKGTFVPAELSIYVRESPDGFRGWVADVTYQRRLHQEKDVEVKMVAAAQADLVRDLSKLLLPALDWTSVAKVRHGNIGVKANEQDAGGMSIFELFAGDGRPLGKLMQIGWGFGICTR